MNQEVTFGAIVKERRQHLGLTQAELARRANCAAITIRKIEANTMRPSVQIAEHLAAALYIPAEEQTAFVRLAREETEPASLPPPKPIPTEIGQQDLTGRAIKGFELGKRIAVGGFGAVYRAVQPMIEREVAIKIILPQYADHPDFIRRFEAEAQLVARLEHPYIVPLYDYWREPAVAYLVMRLMRGGSLQDRLKSGPLSLETTLRVMQQIGDALHTAHRAGVIHRDIKPANILLDEDDNAYLADFGLAKNLGAPNLVGHSQAGTVIGTLEYISPEQIQAEPVRPQSDIYCLGIVLYELLSGQKPFHGSTPVDFIQQHLVQPVPSLAATAANTTRLAALDPVIARATAKKPAERYADVAAMLLDIRQAVQVSSVAAAGEPWSTGATPRQLGSGTGPQTDLDNPFKGLHAFGEADADDFFGRDTLIQALLGRLAETDELARFLAVVGPSGGGKSSVVKAGLIPVLRQGGLPGSENWFIVEMLPGSHPFEELEAALLRVAINPPDNLLAHLRQDERGLLRAVRRILPPDNVTELVLVIDQFEEIFTQCEDEAVRVSFMDSLVTAILDPRSRLRAIITLRADFIDRPLQYVDFGELIRQRTEFVLPLTPDELEEAIVKPTRRVGLNLEPGLISTIIRDLGDQPGTLPLLQYTLTELFERRVGNALTLGAYQTSGGVHGALASRADELFASLDEAGQQATRQLFLRLITVGEVTGDGLPAPDTRRRMLRAELAAIQPPSNSPRWGEDDNTSPPQGGIEGGLNAIIDQFGRHRLLTFDRDPVTRSPTVEVAHEALIREWSQLRRWLDEDREFLMWQQRLRAGLHQWQTSQYDEGALLRGAPLAEAENWLNQRESDLNEAEREFIQAGLALRERKAAEREMQLQRELETAQKLTRTEQHAARRLRWLVVGLAIFLLVAAGLAVFAFNQQDIAMANQAEAESNLALSESQRLAAEANTIMQSGGDPELAALLSLRALNTAYTRQADMALQQASKGDYGRRLFSGHADSVDGLAFSPDGRLALSGSLDTTARLWNVETGQVIHTLTGHTGGIRNVAYSPDGKYLLTGSADKTARLWDAQTGQELFIFAGHTAEVNGVAFSPDGRYALTAGWEGTVRIWDVATRQEVRVLSGDEGIFDMAVSPDGQYLLTGNKATGRVGLSNIATGLAAQYLPGLNTGGTNAVTFSPDGRYALAGHENGGLYVWNLQQTETEPRIFSGHTEWIYKVRVSPDGKYALSAGHDGTARLWDIQSGEEVRRFISTNHITSIAFSPNSQTMLVGERDGKIRLWDVEPPPDPRALRGHTNVIPDVEFSPDGRYALTGSFDQTAKLWDVATGQELHVLRGHTDQISGVAFSPDGRYALTGSSDNTARLWNVETGQEVRVFTHPAGVFGVAFSPDGRYALTGSFDNAAHLWDLRETGQEVRVFTHPTAVFVVVFSPDGRYILTGSFFDGTARLWEVNTGREVRQFPGYAGFVNGLAFSPDGKYIATAAEGTTSQLWDVETGQPLESFPGDVGRFSVDGKYLLTGGLKTVNLWDRATGKQLRTFGTDNNLWTVELSPDGQTILIGGSDQFAQLWDADYHTLVDSVCARVLRDFTDEEREKYDIHDQRPTCPELSVLVE